MKVIIAAIVLVLASGTSFAKEVVCSGTGAASSIATQPRDLPQNISQELGLVIDSITYFVRYSTKTDETPESLSISRYSNSDGLTVVATGSTSGTVEMTVADA